MAVTPVESPLRVAQGSDAVVRIHDLAVDGVPVTSFAGWTFRAQIRAHKLATVTLHVASALDFVTSQPPDLIWKIPASATTGVTWYYGYYDVEAVDPASQIQRIAQGLFALDPETTR